MLRHLRRLLTLLLLAFFSQSNAQDNFWNDVKENAFTQKGNQSRIIAPTKARTLTLNESALRSNLSSAPLEFTEAGRSMPLIISLPMPDGSFQKFAIVNSPVLPAELAAKYPEISTYTGQGVDDKAATIKLDWTYLGFHAMITSPLLQSEVFIDPYALHNTADYISYYKSDLPKKTSKRQEFIEEIGNEDVVELAAKTTAGTCLGTQLRTYRAAIATTGEYTAFFGGTVPLALSAVTTSINRVNSVFERDLSVRLTLVANNNLIIYTDGASDPFTQTSVNSALLTQVQGAIDGAITSANYDIGHLFTTIDGGGLAGKPVVCSNGNKARGATGSASPAGDGYDIDFVAHELGHQINGSHSFNTSCSNNRSASFAYEPGSGVTIMGYAGVCGSSDIASHSIPYFHTKSIDEIGGYIAGAGSSCAVITATGNSIPVVNAGSDYTIPAGTPFILTGSATDANNSEVLTYSWEEIDLGIAAGEWNSGSAPFFRSFAPSVLPTRYLPQLSDVANGITTPGEFLPSSPTVLNFRLTVRDNRAGGGGVCSDEMVVTVSGLSPFTVTSHNTPVSLTANGTNTTTVTWDVANTNTIPFNTSNVTILFSADGGNTFPYTLVASTANDGSEVVVVPAIKTSKGRIMVKAIGNIFFNTNIANITISTPCLAEGAEITPSTNVSGLRGSGALNLSLSPQYTTTFSASGTLTSAMPTGNISLHNNSTGNCGLYTLQTPAATHSFTVSQNGTYTFSISGTSGLVLNIYQNSHTLGSCTNYLGSNVGVTGSSAGYKTLSVSLVTGVTYIAVVQWINGTASLPATYTSITATSSPAGGVLYAASGGYTNPGAGYGYTYVIVKNSTGNIVAIGNPDLSNSTNYPPGQYTIYGMSYQTGLSYAGYVGGSFAALLTQMQNNPSTFCANLSKNNVVVNVTGVLPVQMTALKARKNGSRVDLSWSTLTEQNSSHFTVQRSSSVTDFSNIGKVSAAGNSNSQRDYSFTDAAPLKGWNYYRLQQFDLDGKSTYSNIAAINFDKEGSMIVVYPNPAKDVLNIEYTSAHNGKIELQVIDTKGAVLKKQNIAVGIGVNVEAINIATLSTGTYILRYVDADGNASYIKFIKQ